MLTPKNTAVLKLLQGKGPIHMIHRMSGQETVGSSVGNLTKSANTAKEVREHYTTVTPGTTYKHSCKYYRECACLSCKYRSHKHKNQVSHKGAYSRVYYQYVLTA